MYVSKIRDELEVDEEVGFLFESRFIIIIYIFTILFNEELYVLKNLISVMIHAT